MSGTHEPIIYQLKVVLLDVSPMIWRRLLVCGDSTITDLHYILQITMGWSDDHLHRFRIHGKQYGIARLGGLSFSDDPDAVQLKDFRFRINERFLYEYDFHDNWQHQIRVEAISAPKRRRRNPVCIDGCERDWEQLPRPDMPLTVGLDGGYVHSCAQRSRKHGWFEVIAGKSVTDDGTSKRFAFVNNYDEKPKRRVFEVLKSQGMQSNQQVTFLSDGGDTVRDLQLYLNPNAEHLLDWFHLTMRLTVMRQMAKGLGVAGTELREIALKELERIKWFLWHGNVFRALETMDDLAMDLDTEEPTAKEITLLKKLEEFETYIRNNAGFIVNYGERWRYGETISTAFVESTVNQVVSKRMVKKQQMRWSQKGAHLLLQIRTRVLNDELREVFRQWYPNFDQGDEDQKLAA